MLAAVVIQLIKWSIFRVLTTVLIKGRSQTCQLVEFFFFFFCLEMGSCKTNVGCGKTKMLWLVYGSFVLPGKTTRKKRDLMLP